MRLRSRQPRRRRVRTRRCAASGRSLLCKKDLPLWSKDLPLWNKEKKSAGDLNLSRPRRAPGERKSRNRSFWAPRTTSLRIRVYAHQHEIEQPQFAQAAFEPPEAGTILHVHEQVFEQKAPEIVRDAQGYESRLEVRPARSRGTLVYRFVSVVITALIAAAIGFGIAIFTAPIEKATQFHTLRQSHARRFARQIPSSSGGRLPLLHPIRDVRHPLMGLAEMAKREE